MKNASLIVKLHTSQDDHNHNTKKIIREMDNSIPIYHQESIQELLVASVVVISISPEGFYPSTVLLESLILKSQL